MSGDDVVVTREVTKPWNDSMFFADRNCLAVGGAAQQDVYADTGWTAVHGQVLREPPTATAWSHYAVQAVVLFPTARAAIDFFEASQQNWAGCSNRQLTYPSPSAPNRSGRWARSAPTTTSSRCRGRSRAPSGGPASGP